MSIQVQQICFSTGCKNLITKHFQIFNIIFFEFFGTMFFSYGVLVCTNSSAFNNPYFANGVFSSIFISLSLFLAICWGAQFTGGHFNPAVTLGMMLKKQNRLPLVQGLVYQASQICGAWIGALIAWTITGIQDAPLIDYMPWKYVWYAFGAEIFGTFLFVFFILVVTTPDTTFCNANLQIYIFIPTILMIARQYSYRSQGLNPAFAIAFQFFYTAYKNKWYLWKYVWATFFGPYVGAILAVLFFEYFYRKFLLIYKKRIQLSSSYLIMTDKTQIN